MSERPTPALLASALTNDKIHRSAESLSRVSPKTRARAADRGEAMEDGSFPIRDAADLRRAISAFGRAKDKARAKRHIVKRARALDKIDLLPESWRAMASRELKPRGEEISPLLASIVPAHVIDVLEAKVQRHNLENADRTLSVAKATCVYRRGATAYVENPRDGVTIEQYAHARVNSFLSLLASGVPRNPEYVQDNDLLPGPLPFEFGLVALGNDFKEWEHPRGRDGKFIEKGGWIKVFIDATSTKSPKIGQVSDTTPSGVIVKYRDGKTEVVKPDRIEESDGKARLDTPGGQDDTPGAPNPEARVPSNAPTPAPSPAPAPEQDAFVDSKGVPVAVGDVVTNPYNAKMKMRVTKLHDVAGSPMIHGTTESGEENDLSPKIAVNLGPDADFNDPAPSKAKAAPKAKVPAKGKAAPKAAPTPEPEPQTESGDLADDIDDAELYNALGMYVSYGHDTLNSGLRAKLPNDEIDDIWAAPYLDKLFTWKRVHTDKTVLRGANGDWLKKLTVGKSFKDLGYVSTTTSESVAEGFADHSSTTHRDSGTKAIFTINLKAGQPAIDIDDEMSRITEYSDYEIDYNNEQEILLPRGTTFTVDSIEPDADGILRIGLSVKENTRAEAGERSNDLDRGSGRAASEGPRASAPGAVLDRPGAAPSGEVPVRNRGADTFPGLDDSERARLLGDLQTSAGMDAPTAERAVNTIDSFRRKYGVRVGAVGAIPKDNNPGAAMAWVEQDGTMRFDADSIAAGVLEENYQEGWISSNGVEGLVSHELTHMLQHGYGEKSGAKFNYASIRAETIVINRHFDGDRSAYIRARGRFSGYAAQNTNGHEADAELLSAWTTGVQGPDWHYTWGVSFDEAYNSDVPDTDLVRWEMYASLEPARDPNGPPIVELNDLIARGRPIVRTDQGAKQKNYVEIESTRGEPVLTGVNVAPLVDFLEKNGYNVNRARDGSRNDYYNMTNGEMLGWTPATIVFDDQQSYDKFLRESGLDVFDADTSRMQWMMGNPGGAYKNAVGDYYRRSVEFAEPQYAQIAQRISDYRAGYNRAAPNVPLDTMYRQGARDEVSANGPSVPEEVVGQTQPDGPLSLENAPSVSDAPLTAAELGERMKWVAVVQNGNVVATGRMDGFYMRDMYYVRLEQTNGVWRPGEQAEISSSQIHALEDPALEVPGNVRAIPDAAPADRPADFPAELLNMRTDDFLLGNLPPGWTRQSMDPAGINQSDFVWHDDGRGVFMKATDMQGPNGAAAEADYGRLLRERGFTASHVERGGNDNQLIVSTISGMDLDGTSQWDDVFGINDGEDPPKLEDLELRDNNDLWRMAVTNIVVNNNDRHGGNVLFGRDKDGKGILLPIDHEISMSGNLTDDLPDDPDAILFQIQDLPLAYDVPMQEFILNMDVNDLRAQVLNEMADLQKTMENMYWVSEDNKKLSLDRVKMLQKHVDAVLERLQDGPA